MPQHASACHSTHHGMPGHQAEPSRHCAPFPTRPDRPSRGPFEPTRTPPPGHPRTHAHPTPNPNASHSTSDLMKAPYLSVPAAAPTAAHNDGVPLTRPSPPQQPGPPIPSRRAHAKGRCCACSERYLLPTLHTARRHQCGALVGWRAAGGSGVGLLHPRLHRRHPALSPASHTPLACAGPPTCAPVGCGGDPTTASPTHAKPHAARLGHT
jgi:hypothetical protein